jgi:hypothetical protein
VEKKAAILQRNCDKACALVKAEAEVIQELAAVIVKSVFQMKCKCVLSEQTIEQLGVIKKRFGLSSTSSTA